MIFINQKNSFIAFCTKFIGVIVLYYLLISINYISQLITQLTILSSGISVFFMKLFDSSVNSYQNYILSESHTIQVGFGCEGTEPVALLCAGILAFPVNYKKKIPAIIIGSSLLLLINQLRIIGLFYLTKHNPDLFSLIHNDIFPLITVICSALIFITWIKTMKKRL